MSAQEPESLPLAPPDRVLSTLNPDGTTAPAPASFSVHLGVITVHNLALSARTTLAVEVHLG